MMDMRKMHRLQNILHQCLMGKMPCPFLAPCQSQVDIMKVNDLAFHYFGVV